MKLSQMGIGKNKISSIDEQFPVQDILFKTGQLTQFSSGIYSYDHIPFLIKKKVKQVISETLTKYGCTEILLPLLQPESIWEKSGRLKRYVEEDVMFRTETLKGNYCLAPTAEEAITEFVRNRLSSYKMLPVTYFQIGEKFRNEIRPRGYLLRGKSFLMMDAYSFNVSNEDLDKTYEIIKQAYFEIFNRLEINAIPVGADSGAIGGKKSEEFMVLTSIGEDKILVDKKTNQAINTELLEREDAKEQLKEIYNIDNIDDLEEKRALELGHIFQLGTKYSESMNAKFNNKEGNLEPFYMGCYGIGVSRVVAYLYEQSVTKNELGEVTGFSLPIPIAPYLVQIIASEEKYDKALELYNLLEKNNIKCLFDDRSDLSFGSKIKDVKYLGTPYMIVLGNKNNDNKIEFENTKTNIKEFLTTEEIVNKLKNI